MLFVSILSAKPDIPPEVAQQGIPRRLEWKPPEGVKILGEYWLQEAPARVIVISEADSPAPLFLVNMAWADLFDIEVIPAITAEEGLKLAGQAMQQAAEQPPVEMRR